MPSMGRNKGYDRQELARRAMALFWRHGYSATSIGQLVATTGVSRHGLYAEFTDKRGLFIESVGVYANEVVTPAFGPVEAQGAGTAQIRTFLATQIDRAVSAGLPGPGCLMANLMIEAEPHDREFGGLVGRHLSRLANGFERAMRNEQSQRRPARDFPLHELALNLTIAIQGLWTVSRVVSQPRVLHAYANSLIDQLEGNLSP